MSSSSKKSIAAPKSMTASNAPAARGKAAPTKSPARPARDSSFESRLARHHDELRWLYMELYDNGDMFAELIDRMRRFSDERSEALRKLDIAREQEGAWYRSQDMLGMQMYIDNFAGTIKGVRPDPAGPGPREAEGTAEGGMSHAEHLSEDI